MLICVLKTRFCFFVGYFNRSFATDIMIELPFRGFVVSSFRIADGFSVFWECTYIGIPDLFFNIAGALHQWNVEMGFARPERNFKVRFSVRSRYFFSLFPRAFRNRHRETHKPAHYDDRKYWARKN